MKKYKVVYSEQMFYEDGSPRGNKRRRKVTCTAPNLQRVKDAFVSYTTSLYKRELLQIYELVYEP